MENRAPRKQRGVVAVKLSRAFLARFSTAAAEAPRKLFLGMSAMLRTYKLLRTTRCVPLTIVCGRAQKRTPRPWDTRL